MKIGNLEFPERPVFLAPMEDVTDIGFRLLCRQFGADMVYTEFISSDALIREIKKTKRKILFSEEERPIGIQIYGCDPDTMVEAAKICEEADPDIIDINFGCPVRKIAGKGAGSGMMRTPDIMLEITERVVKAVNKPVSVKTRLGWDDNSKIIVPLAEQLQDCGIVALTIHGRTRSQMYKGDADWSLIREVKNNPRMHIPIIGNGDVTSPEITKLQLVDQNGDMEIEGEIVGYQLTPLAVQEDAFASETRLTMTVRMRFRNNKTDAPQMEETISANRTFSSNTVFDSVQDQLINELIDEIVDQIFNATMANW
jgi:tRNA-dihydrouridine synthase B